MRYKILIILWILFFFSTGIIPEEQGAGFNEQKWEDLTRKSRVEKDTYFKNSPISPMSGLLRETINSDEKLYVSTIRDKIRISLKKTVSPILTVFKKGPDWISIDSSGMETLRKKSRETFLIDRFTFMCYPLKEEFILIVFDPDREMHKKFSHLLYYAPDVKYRVKAKLERFKTIKKRVVKTSRRLEKTLIEYSKVRFTIDGKDLSLLAFKFTTDKSDPNYKYLFLPFFDKTNLSETYEAGRFLEVIETKTDKVIIDFNECYNPLCNYADVYNCTLPPFENELDIEIKAGEKTYPH